MQALEIVNYLEENGLYYQLYTNKGVYVPEYGESVRNEIDYVKKFKYENIDLKELETIAALYLEHIAFLSVESCKPIVETDIHVHKLLPFSYDMEKLKKVKRNVSA